VSTHGGDSSTTGAAAALRLHSADGSGTKTTPNINVGGEGFQGEHAWGRLIDDRGGGGPALAFGQCSGGTTTTTTLMWGGEGIRGECTQGQLINDGGSGGPALGGRGFKVSATTTISVAQSDLRRVASDAHRGLALSHMTCQ
jgi:hypothetical protein